MQPLTILQTISIWIIPVLLAITLHEAAHAWVANRCGDTTAKALGRLSMNPIRHIDPIGTVIVPILLGILSGFHFIFGWAKPVPITWKHLRHLRRDAILVALAGPFANFLMALLWAICAKIGIVMRPDHSNLALYLALTGQAGIVINVILGLLNLLPIPPLDGSRVISALLPPRWAFYYGRIEPFGFLIVLGLLVSGILGWVMGPLIASVLYYLYMIFGL